MGDAEKSGAPPAAIGAPLPLRAGERGTPMSAVDRAWLRMDEPANLMHVHGVLVLDGAVSIDQARQLLAERLGRIPRFAQRVATDGSRTVWTDDAQFDIRRHVTEEVLPDGGTDAALARVLSRHLERPFDRAHPLWEYRLLQGFHGSDTVVFCRIHHAIGDGVALMLVLLSMTDLDAAGEARNPFVELLAAGPHAPYATVVAEAERLMPETMRLMTASAEGFARAGALRRGLGSVAGLGRLLARPADPPTRFKGELGVEKRVAWTPPIPLEEVRALARRLGGTLNDLLNSAMAGGLRRYLADAGALPDGCCFRAAMPVNLRPLDEMAALGNRFGLVFLELPVGVADPLERFERIRRNALALRRSAEPLVVHGLLSFAGASPLALQRLLVRIFGSKATAVFTNVPGPRQPVWFAGRRMRDIFFWVPQAGRLGLGVSILSYCGVVRMGVGTDAGLVPDPERIVDGFTAELEALASRG